jgi:multiple sugar transport system substrate-binding protein
MKKLALFLTAAALTVSVIGAAHPATAQDKLVLWTKFNDKSPQNTQDQWLATALAEYTKETGAAVENVFQPFDQINAKLNVAVQAGGDVPDLSYVDSQQLGFFNQNGTLQDLTEWAKAQPWFEDLDPQAVAACTTPEGVLLCVPTTTANHFMYYWTEYYPDGVPADTEAFLTAAKALKESRPEDFAFTGKLAEKVSVERFYYGLILSFGGAISDAEGRAAWANEATMKTVEFARALFADDYAAKESLAPAFDNEEPFKRGEAGAFVSGSYSYVYLTPITAPDGTKYEDAITGGFDPNALSVGKALVDGKLAFAPPLAAPGGKPASVLLATAYGIPTGAKNVEGAKAFISFQMTTARNIAFAASYGALPSMKSALEAEEFATPYWKGVAELQQMYGVAAPALVDYDRGMTLLADAIIRLITDPSLDIMAELQKAQDEYNAGL